MKLLFFFMLFVCLPVCWAGDVQLVTYLNTRYPLQSPLKAWEVTANQIARDYSQVTGAKPIQSADLAHEQFAPWIKEQFARIPAGKPVLLYMSSHQEKNGDWRFKDGILPAEQIAQALKESIGDRPCLIINDSCHAATWEQLAWPENFRMIYISRKDELNREINLWNDSPTLAGLYAKEIKHLRREGQGTDISYFGILWLGLPSTQIALNSRQWPAFLSSLRSQDSLLRKKVSRIKFPGLVTSEL